MWVADETMKTKASGRRSLVDDVGGEILFLLLRHVAVKSIILSLRNIVETFEDING